MSTKITWDKHVCVIHIVDKLLTKLNRIKDSRFTGRKNLAVLLDDCNIFLRSDRRCFHLLNRNALRMGGSQAAEHVTNTLLNISHSAAN